MVPETQEDLAMYYKEPIICLLRIKDSVEHWIKRSGSDGYFKFLEEWLGSKVAGDNQMNYSIYVLQWGWFKFIHLHHTPLDY